MTIDVTRLQTPVGTMVIAARAGAVIAATTQRHWPDAARRIGERYPQEAFEDAGDAAGAAAAVRAYFAGDLRALDRVEVAPHGTAFQRSIWSALRRIGAGATASYGDLARLAGNPGAVRAAGAACGANPIWVIVPCHRAVRSDGSLGGYAGGLETKRALLEHEGALGARLLV